MQTLAHFDGLEIFHVNLFIVWSFALFWGMHDKSDKAALRLGYDLV